MEWLNILSTSNISFRTYKLYKNDAMIYNSQFNENIFIIIVHGLLYLQKIFNNEENLCLAILTENTLVKLNREIKGQKLCYYKLVSLDTSYIICFENNEVSTKYINNTQIFKKIHTTYHKTILQYEQMIYIFAHKYVKYRLIQLLIFLAKEKGTVNENQVEIPLYINHSTIGSIVGSNKNTIYKIIKDLTKENLINYSIRQNTITILDVIGLNKLKSKI